MDEPGTIILKYRLCNSKCYRQQWVSFFYSLTERWEKQKQLECPKNGNSRRLLRTENLFIIKFACLKMQAYSLPWQADQLKTADKEQKFLLTRLTWPVEIKCMWDSSECCFLKNTYTDFKFIKLSEETVNTLRLETKTHVFQLNQTMPCKSCSFRGS